MTLEILYFEGSRTATPLSIACVTRSRRKALPQTCGWSRSAYRFT